MGTMVL